MKICHLGDINSVRLHNLINYLQKEGYENFLLSLNTPTSQERTATLSSDVKWHVIGPLVQGSYFSPSFWRSRYLTACKIKDMIKYFRADVVHGYYLTDCGLLAAYLKFHPFVVLARGSDVLIDIKANLLKKMAIKYVIKSADLIFCISKQIQTQVLNHTKQSKKVVFLPNGVDLERFTKQPPDQSVIKSLQFEENSKIVITLRNFAPVYNHECLLKAIPLVVKKVPEARFLLLGEGSLKKKLINLSKALNICEYVRFINFVPNGDVPKYLNIAKIYVSTTLSDANSVSLGEAMACEMPVVVSDIPPNKSIIKNFENGFLFPTTDSKELADKIVLLLNNDLLCQEMGKKNREIVSKHFNFHDYMNTIISGYTKVINATL